MGHPDRLPPNRVLVLPLPPSTVLCLVCFWMATGEDVRARAVAHTRENRHPTVASASEAR